MYRSLTTSLLIAQSASLAAQGVGLDDRLRAQDERIAELERLVQEQRDELDAAIDYVDALGTESTSATTLGGYGELHYNNLDTDDPSNDVDEIDFHRFVLFLGHRFNERIEFLSEIEIEHSLAGDGEAGEVELEQAYVDIRLRDSLSARAGLFLLPIGLLNETHEPPSFYGVERNDVESIIVPSTWWEGGGGFSGTLANGIGWDVAMHSGLAIPTEGGNAFRVRSGRQKVSEAFADNWAYTARLRYRVMGGLELAASVHYQSDPSQVAGDGLDSGRLLTANLIYRREDFTLKALYGSWNFDGYAVEAAGADAQAGWFVEPSYRLTPRFGVYARYQDVDGGRDLDRFDQVEAGFNFWPHPSVVLKLDVRQRRFDAPGLSGTDFDGFDLGVGYQF